MKFLLILEARIKDASSRELFERYLQRLQPWVSVETHFLNPKGPKEIASRVTQTLERFKKNHRTKTLLLDERGAMPRSSQEFALKLQKYEQNEGIDTLIILMAGAFQFPTDELQSLWDEKLSLSGLTMPHEMAAAVLAEQLYRAQCILRKHPYHHE